MTDIKSIFERESAVFLSENMLLHYLQLENKRVAILDMGTNTLELLIAEPLGDSFRILHQARRGVFIGRGGIQQGIIIEEAEQRLTDALQEFRQIIVQFQVPLERCRGVATSAFRNAKNGSSIAQRLEMLTGISIEIISGEREAEYIFAGVAHGVALGEERVLVLDIGGGSVECIIGNRHKILWKRSFEVGAQRLKDQFGSHDPLPSLAIHKMEIYLEAALAPLTTAIFNFSPRYIIGSAGTFDTLAAMDYCMQHPTTAPPSVQNGYIIDTDNFYRHYYHIIQADRDARLRLPGMLALRAEMIPFAASLLKFVVEKTEAPHITVSSYALKEGYLLGFLA